MSDGGRSIPLVLELVVEDIDALLVYLSVWSCNTPCFSPLFDLITTLTTFDGFRLAGAVRLRSELLPANNQNRPSIHHPGISMNNSHF